ncbi:MAG: hypothetical protein JO358_06040 [Alphaproteobacteria bacterium]|nr:hypothetical protein [Alphaproteobacteria bacterium]
MQFVIASATAEPEWNWWILILFGRAIGLLDRLHNQEEPTAAAPDRRGVYLDEVGVQLNPPWRATAIGMSVGLEGRQ